MNRYVTWLILILVGGLFCYMGASKLKTYYLEHKEAKKISAFLGNSDVPKNTVTPEEFFNYPPKDDK